TERSERGSTGSRLIITTSVSPTCTAVEIDDASSFRSPVRVLSTERCRGGSFGPAVVLNDTFAWPGMLVSTVRPGALIVSRPATTVTSWISNGVPETGYGPLEFCSSDGMPLATPGVPAGTPA